MTTPTIRDTSFNGDAGTTHAVVLPTTVLSGDKLLALVGAFDAGGTSDPPVTWDDSTAGVWSHDQSYVDAGGGLRLYVFSKVADGSEGGVSLSVSTAGSSGFAYIAHSIQNCDHLDFSEATSSPNSHPDSPSLSPAGGSADTLWISAVVTAGGLAAPPTMPSGYASLTWAQASSSSLLPSLFDATKSATAASEDPGQWTTGATNRAWNAVTIAARLTGQTITAPFLASGEIEYGPSIVPEVDAPFLSSGAQFFGANIAPDQTLVAPFVASGASFFGGVVLAITGVGAPFLASGAQFFGGIIVLGDAVISPPFLASGAQFFPGLVTGGTRTTPSFTHVSVGPAPGAIGDLAIYNTPTRGQGFAAIWEKRGPVGFSDYQPFIAGDYNFNMADVWLRLEVDALAHVYGITKAKVNVDVPDVVDSATVSVASGGQFINFGRTFYAVPKVVANVVTASGVNTVPRVTIRDDVSTTHFFATVHYGDDLTNTLGGTIHYVASGY